MTTKKYAFYSQLAVDKGFPTIFWAKPDGKEVEATVVLDDEDGKGYFFNDKRCLGEVTHYLRQGEKGNHFYH